MYLKVATDGLANLVQITFCTYPIPSTHVNWLLELSFLIKLLLEKGNFLSVGRVATSVLVETDGRI